MMIVGWDGKRGCLLCDWAAEGRVEANNMNYQQQHTIPPPSIRSHSAPVSAPSNGSSRLKQTVVSFCVALPLVSGVFCLRALDE